MAHVEKCIDLRVPVDEVFRTLKNFDEYPNFMEGLREVRTAGPYRMHLVDNWGGTRHEWDARITDSTTNRRLAWISESGDRRDTEIVLEPLGRNMTRMYFALDVEPKARAGVYETADTIETRVVGDLRRFKRYIEGEGARPGMAARGAAEKPAMRGRGEVMGARTGPEAWREMPEMRVTGIPRRNPVDWAAASLVTVGALNRAIEGVFDVDPIGFVFDKRSVPRRVLCGLLGASAVYTMVTLVRADMKTRGHNREHGELEERLRESELTRERSFV